MLWPIVCSVSCWRHCCVCGVVWLCCGVTIEIQSLSNIENNTALLLPQNPSACVCDAPFLFPDRKLSISVLFILILLFQTKAETDIHTIPRHLTTFKWFWLTNNHQPCFFCLLANEPLLFVSVAHVQEAEFLPSGNSSNYKAALISLPQMFPVTSCYTRHYIRCNIIHIVASPVEHGCSSPCCLQTKFSLKSGCVSGCSGRSVFPFHFISSTTWRSTSYAHQPNLEQAPRELQVGCYS